MSKREKLLECVSQFDSCRLWYLKAFRGEFPFNISDLHCLDKSRKRCKKKERECEWKIE